MCPQSAHVGLHEDNHMYTQLSSCKIWATACGHHSIAISCSCACMQSHKRHARCHHGYDDHYCTVMSGRKHQERGSWVGRAAAAHCALGKKYWIATACASCRPNIWAPGVRHQHRSAFIEFTGQPCHLCAVSEQVFCGESTFPPRV